MTQSALPLDTGHAQDLDLAALARLLRGAWLPILLTASALSTAAYFYADARPDVYRTSAGLAALPATSGNALISNSLVTAPALPPQVVDRALRSPEVTEAAFKALEDKGLDPAQRQAVVDAVQAEWRSGQYQTVTLSANVDQNLVGSYEVTAQAGSPEAAQATANAFARALLEWDRQRALNGVERAYSNLTTRLDVLDGAPVVGGEAVDSATANQMRSEVVQSLQQVEVLRETVSGTLSLIAGAVLPNEPVAPKPLRDALLVFGATVFAGLLLALARDRLVKRVQDTESLRSLGLPILGLLPPVNLRRSDPAGISSFLRHGSFREGLEFVRLGVTTALDDLSGSATPRAPLIAISSADMDEGKSVITSGLAATFALRGMRVLVVDADIFRHRQRQLLAPEGQPLQIIPLDDTELWVSVQYQTDLLNLRRGHLNPEALLQSIEGLRQNYDIVLIDTPPILKVADTLALARRVDGLVLVAAVGMPQAQVERVVAETSRLGIRPLGLILNRYRGGGITDPYGYGPSPALTLEQGGNYGHARN
ncbi:tyrosine-protein kinase domain-containing protein [Deinococcus radiophilus]|uniref:Tyrosine-protein kinase family protein n=1 Tax=Deinococcus radiophilus TaxID=32062 RepID=A0A431VQP2_9DEIO|nr:CpsD/CapB family tyrosine-protein kinase [Deinococcus radiophilus]RTR25495.1 tyrosine-protein kinase family protein [Deinococcus radiophilus]UFA51739.1 CpsD/CapB family tyrosine-protein kinase [Deinococcus radiophilus]